MDNNSLLTFPSNSDVLIGSFLNDEGGATDCITLTAPPFFTQSNGEFSSVPGYLDVNLRCIDYTTLVTVAITTNFPVMVQVGRGGGHLPLVVFTDDPLIGGGGGYTMLTSFIVEPGQEFYITTGVADPPQASLEASLSLCAQNQIYTTPIKTRRSYVPNVTPTLKHGELAVTTSPRQILLGRRHSDEENLPPFVIYNENEARSANQMKTPGLIVPVSLASTTPRTNPPPTSLAWGNEYLFCNGEAVSSTTYAALYNLSANLYGPANPFSTFTLPDITHSDPEQAYVITTGL